jgi:hypothetical protein
MPSSLGCEDGEGGEGEGEDGSTSILIASTKTEQRRLTN